MNDRSFVDTNVFIYLYSEDEREKQKASQTAVDTYDCILSTQVLNEFSNVCIYKLGKTIEEIDLAIDEMTAQCTLVMIEKEDVKHALKIHKKYGYNYFDCLMIASALNSDCKYLITEDMAAGQIIDNKLTIRNIYSERG
jgi:predicted nucleic acid-binding protein